MRAQVKPTNTEGLENLFYCSGICVCYILFFSFLCIIIFIRYMKQMRSQSVVEKDDTC